mgnify:CR=1 FL=1
MASVGTLRTFGAPAPLTLFVRCQMTIRYLHIQNVTAKAHFEKEGDVLFRYRLEIIKTGASLSPKTACVVMQNPSYAGEDVADKSVQFMEKNVFERKNWGQTPIFGRLR